MLNNILTRIFGESRSYGITPEQRDMAEINAAAAGAPLIKEEAPVMETVETSVKRPDIIALELKYGPLTEGMLIKTDLHTMLELCPRTRRKRDAYKGLIRQLREDYGVTLEFETIAEKKNYEK